MKKRLPDYLRVACVSVALFVLPLVPSKMWGLARVGLLFDALEIQELIQDGENGEPLIDVSVALEKITKINIEIGWAFSLPLLAPGILIGTYFEPYENHFSVYAGISLTTDTLAGFFLDGSLGVIFNDRTAPYSLRRGNLVQDNVEIDLNDPLAVPRELGERLQCAFPLHITTSVGYEFLGENFPVGQSIMLTWTGTFPAPYCNQTETFVDGIFGSQSIGLRYDVSF